MSATAVRDHQTYAVLGAACATLLVYAAALTTAAVGPLSAAPVMLLLVAFAPGVWRGNGRSAIWYALLCTWCVAHALVLAVDPATRAYGLALLATSAALFVLACAFARRRGIAAQRAP